MFTQFVGQILKPVIVTWSALISWEIHKNVHEVWISKGHLKFGILVGLCPEIYNFLEDINTLTPSDII